ncbi:TPA: restriction endonuclease subunit S [Klebsiella pneumoniae]|nr:restriction endonuclease subunit S [Klebsiella pneumoniae]MCJ1846577.1 restriction endonuclease subunit S [Klebsiella quasipneumoniae subsp. similipneumoniae]HBS5605040.1 restriction endonuclease subunit S [Klebsiella quasipneumoniae subsp. quasipneumoniae]HDG7908827.1 restriction endonuclease subunit S [Klebsiella quasipneumoniae]HDS5113209.1 restriction endonuclease subunit S [Klebsiella variicola]
MLPTGWQKLSLEKCLNIEARKAYIQDNQEYDLVTVKRSRGGVIRREHLKGKDISVKSQFYIKEGDFLISKRQIVHGACGLVPKELSGSIVSNEYCVLTGKSGFYLPYMEFLSESLYFQQTCFHSSIGVHIEKMIFKLDSWFKWPFNIPPLSEQKRIVKILSTWDKAITVTEKLLVNSQQQKKALMQQLLTGKKRLLDENGVRFSGEWEKGKFCDMANIDTGYAFKSKDFTQSDSGIPIIRMSDFKTGGLDVLGAAKVDRDSVNGLDKFKLRVGDFVFGMSGSLNNYGRVEKKDLPCYLNQRVGRILAKECANQAFITYLYLSDSIQQSILDKAAGAAQLNISISDLRSMVVYYPCIEEQQKIAAVLSAADAEISTLEKKLACLRDEKKALMQQLLTGKRRVKVDEAVAE